jgi:hypothetical protein
MRADIPQVRVYSRFQCPEAPGYSHIWLQFRPLDALFRQRRLLRRLRALGQPFWRIRSPPVLGLGQRFLRRSSLS